MNNILKIELRKQSKKLIALALICFVSTTAVFSVGRFSRRVYVNVGDQAISAITLNTETDKILDQVGVSLSKNDTVSRLDNNDGSIELNVKRAFNVSIEDGTNVVDLVLTTGTVADALNMAGVSLDKNDSTNYALDSNLEPNMNIVVSRHVNIIIAADGETKNYLVPKGTVNDAISFLKMPLSSDDIINVDVLSDVYEGLEITINRVKYRETVKTEEIPFNRVTKKTTLLDKGNTQISTEGKNGVKEVTVKETILDGKVVKSEELKSRTITEPIDEITLIGNKSPKPAPAPKTNSTKKDKKSGTKSDESGNSKVLTGSATAYTAPSGARTSRGTAPKEGTIAVDPKVIPYGSRLVVKSVDGSFEWEGIAEDTGIALRKGHALVDLYMDTKSKCKTFGRKQVTVMIK